MSPDLLIELARVFAIESQHARRSDAVYLALVARALRVSADAERGTLERPAAERETVRPPSQMEAPLTPPLAKALGLPPARDRNIAG